MRGMCLVGVLVLAGCTEPVVRLTPPECQQRRVAHAQAAEEVRRETETARAALGEEAATLAWWKVSMAEDKLEEAEEALRGCP